VAGEAADDYASSPADHPRWRATDLGVMRQTPPEDLDPVERDRIVRTLADETG
jgi:hypothetical protein